MYLFHQIISGSEGRNINEKYIKEKRLTAKL